MAQAARDNAAVQASAGAQVPRAQQSSAANGLDAQGDAAIERILTGSSTASIIDRIRMKLSGELLTDKQQAELVALLSADHDVSATLEHLERDHLLGTLIGGVDDAQSRPQLMHILGKNAHGAAKKDVEKYVDQLEPQWQMQFNMARLGVHGDAKTDHFDKSKYQDLISKDPGAPFTGSGATGIAPTSLSMPLYVQGMLYLEKKTGIGSLPTEYDDPVRNQFKNPDEYLETLPKGARERQVQLLLEQKISSVDEKSYGGHLPSRLAVIRQAAELNHLDPRHVTAFILTEQRDQSQHEDEADYIGGSSAFAHKSTSIGLGQVEISTAKGDDLFRDLLSPQTRKGLSHSAIAKLLTSDEYNIFATARYMRHVADMGAKMTAERLPLTKAQFPHIDFKAYARHSSTWNEDNVAALGSEYTSKPWDDKIDFEYSEFVRDALKDIRNSGVKFDGSDAIS